MPQPLWRQLPVFSLLAMLSVPAAHLQANTGARSYQFEVTLDDKVIGTHRFDVVAMPDASLRITSRANFEVRLLGVPFYRYQHQAEERWLSDCLVSIQASTRENGQTLGVRGERQADRFQLQEPAGTAARRDCVTSYAYWNPERLLAARELLNPQTGKFDAVQIERLGSEKIAWRGAPTSAQRYRLVAPTHRIDLWYAESGEWLQLASTARGNKQVFYKRVD